MNNVNWRYHKIFEGIYEEFDGKISEKKYSIFVRDLDKGVVTHVKYAGELLWRNGLYMGFRENVDTGLRLLNTKDAFNFISEIIQKGKAEGILYKLNDFK
jgi:aminoglycoside 3-N-acetyltransferase